MICGNYYSVPLADGSSVLFEIVPGVHGSDAVGGSVIGRSDEESVKHRLNVTMASVTLTPHFECPIVLLEAPQPFMGSHTYLHPQS
jgi:hypothetical protein